MNIKSLLFFVLGMLGTWSSIAVACSCVELTEEQKFQRASSVFIGHVIETRFIQTGEEPNAFNDHIEAQIDVKEIIKGSPPSPIKVRDQIPTPGMCSSFLLAGVEYVLFVSKNGGVGMCGGTHPFRATIYDRKERLEELYELRSRSKK